MKVKVCRTCIAYQVVRYASTAPPVLIGDITNIGGPKG